MCHRARRSCSHFYFACLNAHACISVSEPAYACANTHISIYWNALYWNVLNRRKPDYITYTLLVTNLLAHAVPDASLIWSDAAFCCRLWNNI
jgi:hypothetical protein